MTDVIVYRADWIVPVSQPPLRDGWIAVGDGRILALGTGAVEERFTTAWSRAGASEATASVLSRERGAAARVRDLRGVALLPGLVNAHTHLELAVLRGHVVQAP